MRFIFLSLFPDLIRPYFDDSIMKKALEKQLFEVHFLNLRDYSENKYNKVDDYMIGGGAGLLLEVETLGRAIEDIKARYDNPHTIFLTPAAKRFVQNDAKRLALKKNVLFVCGRYEGFDERAIESYADEVFSIGDFVLSGGELAALCMCDAIARNLEGTLGNAQSLSGESFESDLLEAPNFTKPDFFNDSTFPSEFIKGNHSKISTLKNRMAELKTQFHRPDLFGRVKFHKRFTNLKEKK